MYVVHKGTAFLNFSKLLHIEMKKNKIRYGMIIKKNIEISKVKMQIHLGFVPIVSCMPTIFHQNMHTLHTYLCGMYVHCTHCVLVTSVHYGNTGCEVFKGRIQI